MKRKTLFLFLFGCAVYPSLETAFRGYTHYSMCMAGGLCVCAVIYFCGLFSKLLSRMAIGGLVITCIEFIFGVIFNIILKMHIWDYSSIPFNLSGQICLRLSLLWTFLVPSIFGVSLLFEHSSFLQKPVFGYKRKLKGHSLINFGEL